jgi:hypothetical protein
MRLYDLHQLYWRPKRETHREHVRLRYAVQDVMRSYGYKLDEVLLAIANAYARGWSLDDAVRALKYARHAQKRKRR